MKLNNDSTIVLSFKLFLICLVTTLGLSYLNSITEVKIAATKNDEKTIAMSSVLPDCKFENANEDVFKGTKNGKLFGYVVSVISPKGYGGNIEMLVGMDKDFKITGVKFISMSETPGLGTKVKDESFLSQFIGKIPNKNELKAISGATISSKAVHYGINLAVDKAKEVAK